MRSSMNNLRKRTLPALTKNRFTSHTFGGGGTSAAHGTLHTVSWQHVPSMLNVVLVSSPLMSCAHWAFMDSSWKHWLCTMVTKRPRNTPRRRRDLAAAAVRVKSFMDGMKSILAVCICRRRGRWCRLWNILCFRKILCVVDEGNDKPYDKDD